MRVSSVTKIFTLSVCVIFLAGCCTIPGSKLEFFYSGKCNTEDKNSIRFVYLGAGGYLISRGEDKILLSPFFSNPGLLRVGLGRVSPKKDIIDKYLPDVSDVKAILVAHPHYDHLMDVPYIAEKYAQNAVIYGNKTMDYIIEKCFPHLAGRVETLNEKAGGKNKPGEWTRIPNTNIRIMAVNSKHAPHFLFFHMLGKKKLTKLPKRCPTRARHWRIGQPFTYIIDFLAGPEENAPTVFRIHYQDAATNSPVGFPPAGVENIDMAILCAPSFEEVLDYPESFLRRTCPKHIIVGHWENFFRSYEKPPRTVPFTDVQWFIRLVKKHMPPGADCKVPKPGSCMVYKIEENR